MPRTKTAEDRKSHTIQIRVTESQLDLLQFAADAAHLELSTWIRHLALSDAQERFDRSKGARKAVRR